MKFDNVKIKKYNNKEYIYSNIELCNDCNCKYRELIKLENRKESKLRCSKCEKIVGITRETYINIEGFLIGQTSCTLSDTFEEYVDVINDKYIGRLTKIILPTGESVYSHNQTCEKFNLEVEELKIGEEVKCSNCKKVLGIIIELPIKIEQQ